MSNSLVRMYSDRGEVCGRVQVSRYTVGVKTGLPIIKSPRVMGKSKLLNDRIKYLKSFHDKNVNVKITSF